jgi:hypothetical protein
MTWSRRMSRTAMVRRRTGLRQRVTFDDRHPPVLISQHASSEQPAHAGTHNYRMVTKLRHIQPPVRYRAGAARTRGPISAPATGRQFPLAVTAPARLAC